MTYNKFIELLKKSKYLSDYDFRTFEERYRIQNKDKIIVVSKDKDGDVVLNMSNISMINCPFTYTTNALTGVSTVIIPMREIKTQESALKAIVWMMDVLKDNETINKGGIFNKVLSFFRKLF